MVHTPADETTFQPDHPTDEVACRRWLNQLTDGIPDFRTLQAIATLLEALYEARDWPMPPAHRLPE